MGEPIKIAIVLEGGCLSAVMSAGVPVEFVIIDYDTEGAAPGDVFPIPQGAGHADQPGYVAAPGIAEIDGPFVLQGFAFAANRKGA